MKKTAIIIPCYNEELTIAAVINDCKKYLPQAEIYVCDNNSTDKTVEIAKSLNAVVKYEKRQGKGNVLRKMFREIDADCYVMVDGDSTYPLNNIKQMCDEILNNGIDMVIADRLSATYFKQNKRCFHNVGNKLVRYLINKLFHNNIKDIMSGYRAMSKLFVKTYPVLSRGFEIETEMTIHALDKNFLIKEIPVDYKNRPDGSTSKLNTFPDGILVLKTIFTLFKDYKPFIFFSTVSLILFIVAVILFISVFMEFLSTGLVPRFPTLIISGVSAIMSLLMLSCGIVLQTIVRKHNELYEIMLNQVQNNSNL